MHKKGGEYEIYPPPSPYLFCNTLLRALSIGVGDHQAKPLLIFPRSDEGTCHCMLYADISQREPVHLSEPEVETLRISVLNSIFLRK
jgi:hypothetical protein